MGRETSEAMVEGADEQLPLPISALGKDFLLQGRSLLLGPQRLLGGLLDFQKLPLIDQHHRTEGPKEREEYHDSEQSLLRSVWFQQFGNLRTERQSDHPVEEHQADKHRGRSNQTCRKLEAPATLAEQFQGTTADEQNENWGCHERTKPRLVVTESEPEVPEEYRG